MATNWTNRDAGIENYLLCQDGSFLLNQDGSLIIYSEKSQYNNRTKPTASTWNVRDYPAITWAQIDDTWSECNYSWESLGGTIWTNRVKP